jgi:hypothetical protein
MVRRVDLVARDFGPQLNARIQDSAGGTTPLPSIRRRHRVTLWKQMETRIKFVAASALSSVCPYPSTKRAPTEPRG